MPDSASLTHYFSLFDDSGALKKVPANGQETYEYVSAMLSEYEDDIPGLSIAAYIDYLEKNHPELMPPEVRKKIAQDKCAYRLPTNHRIFAPQQDKYRVYSSTWSLHGKEATERAVMDGSLDMDSPNKRRSLIALGLQQDGDTATKVLDIADLNAYIQGLNIEEDKRYQVIVDTNGHFTAVDIEIRNGKKQCVILDAANDPRMDDVKMVLELNRFDKIHMPLARSNARGVVQTLQRDATSCPFFAYEHAKQMASLPDLYERMEHAVEADQQIYFDRLLPELVRCAQSMSFLEHYQHMPENKAFLERQLPNGQTLAEYFAVHVDESKGKAQNHSMEHTKNRMIAEIRMAHPDYQKERQALVELKESAEKLDVFDKRAANPKINMGDLVRTMQERTKSIQEERIAFISDRFAIVQSRLEKLSFGTKDNHLSSFLETNKRHFDQLQKTGAIEEMSKFITQLENKCDRLQKGVNSNAQSYIQQQRAANRWYTIGKERDAARIERSMNELTIEQRLKLAGQDVYKSTMKQDRAILKALEASKQEMDKTSNEDSSLTETYADNSDDEWDMADRSP